MRYGVWGVLCALLWGCSGNGGSGQGGECFTNPECQSGQYCGPDNRCTFDCIEDRDCAGLDSVCNSLGQCVGEAMPDAALLDAAPVDGGTPDAAPVDGGTPDGGILDAGMLDAAADADTTDASVPDAAIQTTCLDNGVARSIVEPGIGEMVVTEFMANPATPIDDAVGEWFEVVATADFDLNGLVVGTDPLDPKLTVVDLDCIPVTAGDRILFGRSADSVTNGGMDDVDYTFSFGLTNSNSSLFVGVGSTVVDTVTWTSSTAGASTALDPGSLDATANDNEANWCDGQADYGSGNLGSPRTANPLCDTSGMCMDGGSLRATVPPVAADVTITEWMANPDVVSDVDAEWFEVHFASAVDLNGLQLGKEVGPPPAVITTLNDSNCISIPANTYVIFGRDANTTDNGGLPGLNFFLGGISLVNGSGTIFVGIANTILDEITYVGSAAGASTQVDDNGLCCAGTDLYGPVANDNLGTPGGANNICAVNDSGLCP